MQHNRSVQTYLEDKHDGGIGVENNKEVFGYESRRWRGRKKIKRGKMDGKRNRQKVEGFIFSLLPLALWRAGVPGRGKKCFGGVQLSGVLCVFFLVS